MSDKDKKRVSEHAQELTPVPEEEKGIWYQYWTPAIGPAPVAEPILTGSWPGEPQRDEKAYQEMVFACIRQIAEEKDEERDDTGLTKLQKEIVAGLRNYEPELLSVYLMTRSMDKMMHDAGFMPLSIQSDKTYSAEQWESDVEELAKSLENNAWGHAFRALSASMVHEQFMRAYQRGLTKYYELQKSTPRQDARDELGLN